jgi:ribonuclease HI
MFFHEELADTILRIPISRRGGEDFVSWPHDKFGIYTVRSAYNLARTASFYTRQGCEGKGAGSDRVSDEKNWKAVWSIQAPGKMKVVLWRMIHDCLPTGHQLIHRHIPADGGCVFCGQLERVEHLFLFCPFARSVWKVVKEQYPLQLQRKKLVHAKQWVFDFLRRESGIHATVLAATCWHIWQARNDIRNNEVVLHPARVASQILAYVEMIVTFLFKAPKPDKVTGVIPGPRWCPPPTGVVAVNVDAALFPAARRMGWGAVLRDHCGAFVLCVREGLEVFPTPELAEALAVRRALMVAKEHGVMKVALVSDCLSLIQRINSRIQDRSSAGSVIGDIKSLATDFESCSFSFSSRNSNVVAHKLARSAESSVCSISVGVIPELIREELCNDVS